MENNWLSIEYMEQQEIATKKAMEDFFGKDRKGFCDYALNGIDLMIKGVLYLRDSEIDKFVDDDVVKYNDFKHALRIFSYHHHYHRIIFCFKAAYNLLLQGYYTESAFLMRHVVETFVRLKYIAKMQNEDFVNLAFSGHRGLNGKRFNVTYENQFNEIAPGLYKYYRTLCDISHGAIASSILRSDVVEGKIQYDTGIVFRPKESTYVINQFSVYLLAHIEFMRWVFPEIDKNRSESYATKEHKTLAILWQLMEEISKDDKSKRWYDSVKQLVNT